MSKSKYKFNFIHEHLLLSSKRFKQKKVVKLMNTEKN